MPNYFVLSIHAISLSSYGFLSPPTTTLSNFCYMPTVHQSISSKFCANIKIKLIKLIEIWSSFSLFYYYHNWYWYLEMVFFFRILGFMPIKHTQIAEFEGVIAT